MCIFLIVSAAASLVSLTYRSKTTQDVWERALDGASCPRRSAVSIGAAGQFVWPVPGNVDPLGVVKIRIFAYFKNFVLIACYLGFGLGCYLCRRRVSLPARRSVILLTVLIKLPWTRAKGGAVLTYWRFRGVDIWGVPRCP